MENLNISILVTANAYDTINKTYSSGFKSSSAEGEKDNKES